MNRSDAPTDRAQSHTVGVILLTAVIVILMGVFGAFYLGVTTDRVNNYGPLVDADVNATADQVTVVHVGGDAIAFDDLDIVVRVGGANERFPVDAVNVSGDGDDRFDPTERFVRDHGLGSGEMEILVVHTPSNTILLHEHLDVRSP